MQRVLILSLVLFPLWGNTQSFVDTLNRWHETYWCNGFDGSFYSETTAFAFQGTETVNDQLYSKLLESADTIFSEDEFTGLYYREDSLGRVFFYHPSMVTEVLIYDFLLEMGDLFEARPNVILEVILVYSIMLMDGSERRRLVLRNVDPPFLTVAWIEGMGGTEATMDPYNWLFTLDCGKELACYYRKGEMLYAPGDCKLGSVSINDVETTAPPPLPRVFPNPVSDFVTIEMPEPGAFDGEIFDITGRRLTARTFRQTTQMDLSDLPAGCYHLRLTERGGGATRWVQLQKLSF